jgi:hypothetical protein
LSQAEIENFLAKGREEWETKNRLWAERWVAKSNREKALYLVGLTNVTGVLTGVLTENDGRILQAAQVFATLALTDPPID